MNPSGGTPAGGEAPAGAAPEARQGRYPVTPWSVQRLYRPYIRASIIVALLYGYGTGAGMMLAPAFGIDRGVWWIVHGQAHGVAQIYGWAGLFIMGVSFHVVPRFRNGPMDFPWPQRAILVLVIVGVSLRFFGQSFHRRPFSEELLVASGVVLLAGVLLYAIVIGRALYRGQNPRAHTEAWIWSAVAWAVISTVLHVRVVFWMAENDALAAHGLWNVAMIDAGLVGFLVIFILGIAQRAVVGFLALKPTFRRLSWISLALLNIGTAWHVMARSRESSDENAAVGLLIQAVGFVLIVIAIRIFEPPARKNTYIEGTYARYEWFIKLAFAWLLVAAVLVALDAIGMLSDDPILEAPLSAPITHVLTLGFVTMVIFGVGIRMLTLFEGAEVPLHWLMDLALATLTLSTLLRVVYGFGSLPGAEQFQGVSGGLGLVAFVAFGWVLFRSMTNEQRAKYARRAAEAGLQRFAQVRVAGARPVSTDDAGQVGTSRSDETDESTENR